MGTLLNNDDAVNSSELHFIFHLSFTRVIYFCSKSVETVHA